MPQPTKPVCVCACVNPVCYLIVDLLPSCFNGKENFLLYFELPLPNFSLNLYLRMYVMIILKINVVEATWVCSKI